MLKKTLQICALILLCSLFICAYSLSVINKESKPTHINPSHPVYWQSAGSALLTQTTKDQTHYQITLYNINDPMLVWTPNTFPSVKRITIQNFLTVYTAAAMEKSSQSSTIAFLENTHQNPNSPTILQAKLSQPIYDATKHTLQYQLVTSSKQTLPPHLFKVSLSFDGFFNPCMGFYIEHYQSAHLLESFEQPMERLHASIIEDQNAINTYDKNSKNDKNNKIIVNIQENLKNNCKRLRLYVNQADPIFTYLLQKSGQASSCHTYLTKKYCNYLTKYQDTTHLCHITHAKGLPTCN